MTILFVTHYAGYYGANKSMVTLISLLREKYGVKPLVLLPSEGAVCHNLKENNISYLVHHYYWWVNDNKGVFQYWLNKRKQLKNIFKYRRISKLLQGRNIDLVYSNSVTINIGMLFAKQLHVPHVWHFRESLSQFNLSLSLSLSLSLWNKPQNKKYILISDYMMDFYRKYLPQDRMMRIYNGVDLPKGVSRTNPNVVLKRLKVAIVGVACDQKNQMELLQAQALLKAKGVEIETYVIGTNKKEYLAQLEQYIAEHDLKELVHLVGHTDDVFSVLQEMNLGVVCAKDEAFGRTTIEFMLMKMPVVVSDSGANAELVCDGVDGMVYPLGNVSALADAIRNYVENPKLLEEHGKTAYEHARENFSAEQNAEIIYKTINEIMR